MHVKPRSIGAWGLTNFPIYIHASQLARFAILFSDLAIIFKDFDKNNIIIIIDIILFLALKLLHDAGFETTI